jgi:hypothetical protein
MLNRYCVYAKIYGERNSGTNFVEQLVRTNFAVLCLQSDLRISEYVQSVSRGMAKEERGKFSSAITDIDCERTLRSDFGWKHGIPPLDAIASAPHARHTLFICVAKHPLAWLQSIARRPYNPIDRIPGKFSRFLRYDWPLTQRDNLPGREHVDVVGLWNVKNAAYRNLQNVVANCRVVAYEDILRNPSEFLADIGSSLFPKRLKFVWSLPSTKGERTTFEEYRQKYELRNICRTISAGDLEFIGARIDREVMTAFGYRWPSPESTGKP